MVALIRKLTKYLAYMAAAVVMLLALLVGLARLLLPLVPDYQEDIRTLAAEATGFDVRFNHISASWPISGPEIRFLEVTVRVPGEDEPVFVADRLDIGISLATLLRDRSIAVSRLGIANTRVEIERVADGSFLVQNRPLAEFLPRYDPDRPLRLPDLEIRLAEVDLAYRDRARSDALLNFRIQQVDVTLGDADLAVDGEIRLPEGFGEQASLSIEVPLAVILGRAPDDARDWGGYASAESMDFARVLEYALGMPTPVVSMNGSLLAWLRFAGRDLAGVTTEMDFSDIVLRRSAGETDSYERIEGRIEWERRGGGWLLAGSALDLRGAAGPSPRSAFSLSSSPGPAEGSQRWQASAEFLRLHDWFPILRALISEEARGPLRLPTDLAGDIRGLRLDLRLSGQAAPEYDVELRFDDLGISESAGGRGFGGLSGELVADDDGGRLQLDSDQVTVTVPEVFAAPLPADSLEGLFVWRITRDGVMILSDNVSLATSFGEASSRFALDIPRNGNSPYLDLTARASASHAPGVVEFLPLRRFPDKVSAWLRRAIVAGRVTGGDIEVRGPLRAFPFDKNEGVFRIDFDVADGVLDYAPGWPRAEQIDGHVVFNGLALYTRRNRANYGGIPVSDADVRIANLRRGVLEITGPQVATAAQVLAFLRASPIADAVGPMLQQVEGRGELRGDVSLRIPVTRPQEYDLRIDVSTDDAEVDLRRLDFGLTKIRGSARLRNTVFYADGLVAEMLGEPVTIRMRPAEPGGIYSQFVSLTGQTPVRSWIDALKLPQADQFGGEARWQAMALFPARRQDEAQPPLHILVRSDLAGVESRLPVPLAKPADAVRALEIDVAFPSETDLEVTGRLAREVSWALQFVEADGRWRVERGAVHAGSAAALLPLDPGIELSGHAPEIRVDDWLALAKHQTDTGWRDLYQAAVLQVDRMSMFGQVFPDVSIEANRVPGAWLVAVDGPNLAGTISVPLEPDNDSPAVLDFARLWLLETEPGEGEAGDPRSLIPVNISADDFIVGKLHFGSLQASIESTPSGIVVAPIAMASPTFKVGGDAAWLVHPNDEAEQQSRMSLALVGSDIRAVLASFGYDPVIEGDSVVASAELTWPGAPDGDFLYRADGRFSVEMKKGAVLSLEPGGGRLLGVLSVTALPRRLAFDFSDVTDEGLGFDILRGDFTVDDGNVYTCNLGLEGSVADLGIVGRTGLEAEDYDQLAVVRPHVSNLLAVGGAVVGGPAAGAAILLFSQIFRKPLSQLGESYYRVTGNWEDPSVEQLQGRAADLAPLKNCEAYLDDALKRSQTP